MQNNNNNLAPSSFVFNPEPVDLTPQVMVGDVNLTDFIKAKQLVRLRKGVYELLNRSGNGRVSGSLAKLRDFFDELAIVTDDDVDNALKTLGVGKKTHNGDVYNEIKKFIYDYDVISIASENKYYLWQDSLEHAFDFSGLRKKAKALRSSDGNSMLDDIMEEECRVYNARDFSANEDNLPKSVYNTVSLINNGIAKFDLSGAGECDPVIDCLFDTVSGMCPISKEILEKSFVMMYMNTINKRLQNRPPIFVLFGGGGTGKTRLFSNFSSILLGRKVCSVVGVSAANSNFNGYMVGKRVVMFNELKGVNREKLTEEFKSYADDIISVHEKGREARDIENVSMIVVSTNGYEGSIIAEGDNGGVDRRFQFVEGKTKFKDEALRRGLIAPLTNEAKTAAAEAELENRATTLLSEKLKESVVVRHMQYLINKHYESLEAADWRVSSVKTAAYDVYLKRQAPAWVTKFIDWVKVNVKPGAHCTPKQMYENYVSMWSGEKTVMKYETFLEKVSNQIENHPDLKGIYKFTTEPKSVRYGAGFKKVNGIYITDEAWKKANPSETNGDEDISFFEKDKPGNGGFKKGVDTAAFKM